MDTDYGKIERTCPRCRAWLYHWLRRGLVGNRHRWTVTCAHCGHAWRARLTADEQADAMDVAQRHRPLLTEDEPMTEPTTTTPPLTRRAQFDADVAQAAARKAAAFTAMRKALEAIAAAPSTNDYCRAVAKAALAKITA